jgi:hypothetical protein
MKTVWKRGRCWETPEHRYCPAGRTASGRTVLECRRLHDDSLCDPRYWVRVTAADWRRMPRGTGLPGFLRYGDLLPGE